MYPLGLSPRPPGSVRGPKGGNTNSLQLASINSRIILLFLGFSTQLYISIILEWLLITELVTFQGMFLIIKLLPRISSTRLKAKGQRGTINR